MAKGAAERSWGSCPLNHLSSKVLMIEFPTNFTTALKNLKLHNGNGFHTDLSNHASSITHFHTLILGFSIYNCVLVSHIEKLRWTFMPQIGLKQKQLWCHLLKKQSQLQCYRRFSKLWSSGMAIYNYPVLFKENRKLKDIHVKKVIHKCLPPKWPPFYPVFFIN